MAHLLLRKSLQIVDLAGSREEVGKTGPLLDLAFLELADSDGKVAPHSIYQGHMSVVICGWSNLQWTGYAFTKADNDDLDEEDQEELRGHFLTSLYGFDFCLPRESANCWDARRYWLRLVAHRCQYVLREWLYLVRTVEEGVEHNRPASHALRLSRSRKKKIHAAAILASQTCKQTRFKNL
jgi:hypothetical protein